MPDSTSISDQMLSWLFRIPPGDHDFKPRNLWPRKGLSDAQLGPNRNGRTW